MAAEIKIPKDFGEGGRGIATDAGPGEPTLLELLLNIQARSDFFGNFTNATRPDPTTIPKGGRIYNESDDAPNYSNGTIWTNAVGTPT